MTEQNDLDSLAAEYVLGTLADEARATFEQRLAHDRAAQEAVAKWSQRLQPLADAVVPSIPSPDLWAKIESRLGGRKRLSRRPWFAVAAAAAVLVALLIFNLDPGQRVSGSAVLAAKDNRPAFRVELLQDGSTLLVQPETVDALADGSYELWLVPEGKAPVSLGVLDVSQEREHTLDSSQQPLMKEGAVLAVSLEPKGGSPTGAPTGPILFTGVLTAPN